jgi:PAS domain S-box-containing protein
MINAFLQERAVLYVSGAMLPQEREQFELVLEFHYELRECVGELAEVGAAITLRPGDFRPSPGLKARILGLLRDRAQQVTSDGLIMSGPAGLVQWINPAFSAMCGYTLEELRGKKLGPILQGEKTDRETAERLRRAVHEYRSCREAILNYRKNGEPYWVEISMTPILDRGGQPLWLVARERKLAERIAA